MIQAIYHNTGLTPDDIIDARAHGRLKTFNVKPRRDGVHVMLYPKKYSQVKIQILNYVANVWSANFDQLDEVEDFLNKTFGDSSNPKPFKEFDFQLNPGERQKILDTFLGQISTFVYYNRTLIADALYQHLKYTYNYVNCAKMRATKNQEANAETFLDML